MAKTAKLSSTPTRLGRSLKAHAVIAKRITKSAQSLKDTAYPPKHANARVRDAYKDYCQRSRGSDVPPISEASVNEFVSRVGVVARLFLVSPPPDPAAYARNCQVQLDMMFVTNDRYSAIDMLSDLSDLKNLGRMIGEKVMEYLSGEQDPLTGGLAVRMFILRDFHDEVVDTPINLSWNYLILHQLIFERVAVQYPEICGFQWESGQTIQQNVNNDLLRLFTVALEDDVDDVQRHSIKVCIVILFILILYRKALNFSWTLASLSSLNYTEIPHTQKRHFTTLSSPHPCSSINSPGTKGSESIRTKLPCLLPSKHSFSTAFGMIYAQRQTTNSKRPSALGTRTSLPRILNLSSPLLNVQPSYLSFISSPRVLWTNMYTSH